MQGKILADRCLKAIGAAFLLTSCLFGVSASAASTSTIFTTQVATNAATASKPIEVGVKFQSDSIGTVVGVRFYKLSSANSGTHIGSLWSASGVLLASATFTNETSSGWQTVLFNNPVSISAGTTYIASYHTTTQYSVTRNYFTGSSVDNPPLHALQSGVSGVNGVYAYGSGPTFPVNGVSDSNWWSDVLFQAPSPPSITAISPSSATAGGPGFTLTVTGQNFSSQSLVQWNGSSRPTSFISSSELTASILASDIASAETATITVSDPATSASNAVAFTVIPATAPPGCGKVLNVKQDGTADFTSIHSAVDSLAQTLSTNTCVVVQDTGPYTEQVTIQNFQNNGFQLSILPDPSLNEKPVLDPPAGSTAAFSIVLSSNILISGMAIVPTNTIANGIAVNDGSYVVEVANLVISSVSVLDPNGHIPPGISWANGAGIYLWGSYLSVVNSTVVVKEADAIMLRGNGENTIAHDYFQANAQGAGSNGYAFHSMGGSQYNTITDISAVSLGQQYAGFFDDGTQYCSISRSTFTGGQSGITVYASWNDTFTGIYSSGQAGVNLEQGANGIVFRDSTLVGDMSGGSGIHFDQTIGDVLDHVTASGGYGAVLYNSNSTQILNSTITSNNPNFNAVALYGSSTNTLTGVFASDSAGTAVLITGVGSDHNTIFQSTITSTSGNSPGVTESGVSNSIFDSYVQGSDAVLITGSTSPAIGGSTLVATSPTGVGLRLTGGSIGLVLSTTTIVGGPQGVGILLDQGTGGSVVMSSDPISGSPIGLSIATQAAGGTLQLSNLAFAEPLPAGTTAISFLGGTFVSTFSAVGFNSSNIATNVSAAALSPGSRITMVSAAGIRAGPSFENDPNNVVDWPGFGAPSCLSSNGAWQNTAFPAQAGTFEAQVQATPGAAKMDGTVGLSSGPAGAFTDLASIVRFNGSGFIDARNGGTYTAVSSVPYSPGTTYYFRLDVNVPAHQYDAYVSTGGLEQALATGYAFRTEQSSVTVLSDLSAFADVGSETVCGFSLSTSPLNPVPSIASMGPTSAIAGGPGFTLNLAGSGFTASSVAQWNGASLPTSFFSSGQLTAQVSASLIASPGQATVTVFNPSPGGGTSNAFTFRITPSKTSNWTVAALAAADTLTTLGDGRVLGTQGNGDINSAALLYNRASDTWTATAPTGAPDSRQAVLLPSGLALIAGGDTPSCPTGESDLFDIRTQTSQTTGSMNVGRFRHTITLLSSGTVLAAGGSDDCDGADVTQSIGSAEIYNPATGSWAMTSPMSVTRDQHTATRLGSGKVLVAGGTSYINYSTGSSHSTILASAEVYDPVTGQWSPTGSMATGRTGHSASLLPNGKVLVAGGTGASGASSTTEIYDPASGSWTPGKSMSVARSGHAAITLADGRILVVGGSGDNSAEIYDPATGNWTSAGYTAQIEQFPKAALLQTGEVLVDGAPSGDVERFNPGTTTTVASTTTIFTTQVPTSFSSASKPIEVGVKFRSDSPGNVVGVRFYKLSSTNSGTHTGSLWSSSGVLLASATFTNETASGWQTVSFASPIAISSGLTYIASYHTTTQYSVTRNYFTNGGVDNAPLHALKSGVDGVNGVYAYGSEPTFPVNGVSDSNWWADVIFQSTGSAVVSQTPSIASIAPSSATAGSPAFTLAVAGQNFTSSSTVRWNGSNRPTSFVSASSLTAAISSADVSSAGTAVVSVFDLAGGTSNSVNFTINPASVGGSTSTIFTTQVPTNFSSASNPIEVGVKFRSDAAGNVVGVRFYKLSSTNSGTHIGDLWSSSGQLLASATFVGESASGWQTVFFSTPVAIQSGTTYIASYHTTTQYSVTRNYFTSSGVDSPPLHALQSGVDGVNGVYSYGSGPTFPVNGVSDSNWWADVIFQSTGTAGAGVASVASLGPVGSSAASLSADPTFEFRDFYAFPNPSRHGQRMTIRLQPGLADTVDVRIYDLSGHLVNSGSVAAPTVLDDGNGKGPQYTYDYPWDVSGVGSGVYLFSVTAHKSGQGTIGKTGKGAVIK